MKKSKVTAPYFDAHVKPLSAKSETWNDGVSLRVRYRLTFDWVTLEREDQLITFVNPKAAPYPALKIPLGKPLNAEQISRAAAANAWATEITSIPTERLKFASQAEALAVLRALPEGKTLQHKELSFNRPGLLPRDNGHPHLHAYGTIDERANRCVSGIIDLISGEAHVTPDVCRMN